MSSSRDAARMRLGLNPLTTTLLGPSNPHHHGTPISAVSMSSSHFTSAQQTPNSAIQPYNPQQWVASPAQSVDRPHQYAGDAQGSALPPPPYSPPRSQHQHSGSGVYDPATTTSTPPSQHRIGTSQLHRPSPEPQQSFPPPPGSGGRGSSRDRSFMPFFGRRNRDHDQQVVAPEPQRHAPSVRQSIGPGSLYSPEPLRPTSTLSNHSQIGPPNARRAVSAGAIETPTSARSRSGSQTRGEPGMSLPPPPPGPPPSNSRSQSVQGMDRSSVPIIAPPTRRPRPAISPGLGPVPPTPADWVDEPVQQARSNEPAEAVRGDPGLSIDTETARTAENVPDPLGSSNSASGLNRAKAVRHDKTIAQRRSESRTRQGVRASIDERAQPGSIKDIVVPESAAGPSTRPAKLTPRTGELSGNTDSRNSTPRNLGSAKDLHPIDTRTPPLTPYPPKLIPRAGGSSHAPKSLPTPPPQVRSASSYNPRDSSRPPTSASTPVSKHLVITQNADQFAAGAVERYQAFVAKEAAAATDADRVRMFADFMVNESRLRRERYATAIGAMGSEIFDLTRDLFRPMVSTRRTSTTSQEEWTPESSQPTRSQRGSFGPGDSAEPGSSSAPGSARLPPSPNTVSQTAGPSTSNFMPSLSPILSMSVRSEQNGDGSSRGRPSSRWWESSSHGDPAHRLERSKRESKYMGVPKDQWAEEEPSQSGSSGQQLHDSEYPPEKTGWHDQREEATHTPQPHRFSQYQAASTPSPAPGSFEYMDVSRLVTLPPPYPRHHPAVNNNHPELAEIRTSVRTLSDFTEMDQIKEKFALDSSKRREEFEKEASERKRALRANLQEEINAGNLGYADAGAIETDSQTQENDKTKELEKAEYEKYQNDVIMPLNDLLTARIERATGLYDDLCSRLFESGENDVDMPQEEGDDRPELLEKLTLLKWIFEARESLHRAIYDILSDRNNRFREVVILPYRLLGNTEKMKNAEAFFDDDASKREYDFANEVLNRARDFRAVVDGAVQRGVALQLSAFWDIAPPLYRLVEKIPQSLEGFNIQIPPAEIDENPSYFNHPMQYLLTLLNHTEKSAYQFIEAHTNLLCLLHEVKEAVVHAKARVLAAKAVDDDGTPMCSEDRDERVQTMRRGEERRLTEDLKEKVRVVQDQWNNALAESIRDLKERIGEYLLQTGGWDETLIEECPIAAV